MIVPGLFEFCGQRKLSSCRVGVIRLNLGDFEIPYYRLSGCYWRRCIVRHLCANKILNEKYSGEPYTYSNKPDGITASLASCDGAVVGVVSGVIVSYCSNSVAGGIW